MKIFSNDPNCPAIVDILVTSRKLKNEESSPTEVLFKTHSYEIKLIPNEHFFEWNGGRKSGYSVELKLFKKSVKTKVRKSADLEESSQDVFTEHVDCGVPLISYTFTEDIFTNTWLLNLIWPDEKTKTSFRGDFYFSIAVFRKIDDDTYRRIFTRISSRFKVVSKPGVYLSKKRKKGEEEEVVDTDSKKKKVPPPSKMIPQNPSSTVGGMQQLTPQSVHLLPSFPQASMTTPNRAAINQHYSNMVYGSDSTLSSSTSSNHSHVNMAYGNGNQFFPETSSEQANIMQVPKQSPPLEASQLSFSKIFSLDKNLLPSMPSLPTSIPMMGTQDFLSFTQNSQFLSQPHATVVSSTAPAMKEEDPTPFSPLTPYSATPTGIFGQHQASPLKGVLSLNFSQEAAPTSQDDWNFYSKEDDNTNNNAKDDFVYNMLGTSQ